MLAGSQKRAAPKHLQGFSGVLQAEACSGHGALYRSGQIAAAGCRAHARRKFHDLSRQEQSFTAQNGISLAPSGLEKPAVKMVSE